jgi:3-isopropylmalate/(R)-2-methylmalate dehydratase small subunit
MLAIGTDQLIPARFMSTPRKDGYGRFLLHDQRQAPGHPLDAHPGASVLVTRANFGCGSSREAAVYALVDAGFRTVIAPSFGDIFAANAVNNGLLPATVHPDDAEALIASLGARASPATIDLMAGTVRINGLCALFDLPAPWRTKLANGWDDIDLTASHSARIAAFAAARNAAHPWVRPHDDA